MQIRTHSAVLLTVWEVLCMCGRLPCAWGKHQEAALQSTLRVGLEGACGRVFYVSGYASVRFEISGKSGVEPEVSHFSQVPGGAAAAGLGTSL